MSRIAIISDMHSNLPAMESVLKNIEKQNIDYIYSLGDIIGKGPSPAPVVELCKNYCTKSILGNWEDFLINSKVQEDPILYYRQNLKEFHIDYLKSLDYKIEFYLSGKLFRLYHANPHNVYKRIFPHNELTDLAEMFEPSQKYGSEFPDKVSDISIYGDIHYAYTYNFDELFLERYYKEFEKYIPQSFSDFYEKNMPTAEKIFGKTLHNIGSVGQPFDGILATYMILDGKLNSTVSSDFEVELLRTPYDNEKSAKIALESSMYDKKEYSREILTGKFRGFYPNM